MPISGGLSWPPSEEAVSTAAAVTRGKPAFISAGMLAEAVVAAFGGTGAGNRRHPEGADDGGLWQESRRGMARREEPCRMESMHPKARNTASTRMNEPIRRQAQLRHAFEDAGRHLDA